MLLNIFMLPQSILHGIRHFDLKSLLFKVILGISDKFIKAWSEPNL